MSNQNALCVNPCELDEIAERVGAARATLDLIHADVRCNSDVTEDKTAARALYGLMFTLDGIRESVEALIDAGEKVTA